MIVLMLTLVTVFVFTTTAFATDFSKTDQKVYGGVSQTQTIAQRHEYNTMDVEPYEIGGNDQSGWKYRGYIWGPETVGTELKSIYTTAYYCADYIAGARLGMYRLKMSITSSDPYHYVLYSANFRI